jgi:membrane fusion protein, multidrug efflux system
MRVLKHRFRSIDLFVALALIEIKTGQLMYNPMSGYVELQTGSAMIVSIDDSPSTTDPRSPVHVLPIVAEPLPRVLNDLSAQLVAFETRKRGSGVRRSVSLLQRMSATAGSLLFGAVFLAFTVLTASHAMAQPAASAPPAVGVVTVERQPMTDSYEFNGRIQPINSVNIVARVTAWLDKQLFAEGTDVKKGDLLYRLEKAPFQAAVDRQKAAVAQAEAQLENDNIDLQRKQRLVMTNAVSQQALDNALAAQRVAAAQLKSAQAQLETAQIDLNYTDVYSPIDGRIGRTSVTIGNVVSSSSGTLTTVVSQDPIYVIFPIPTRRAIELRKQYGDKGGFEAVKIRLRLPDGSIYDHTGKLDFVNNAISENTDTLLIRAVISNPILASQTAGGVRLRELVADEFVTVLLESVDPRLVIGVPRAAILADQQGNYVYVVDENNVARQRRVRIGQTTPETAGIVDGLKEGERIVVEGLQRARPDSPVAPAPATSIASRS